MIDMHWKLLTTYFVVQRRLVILLAILLFSSLGLQLLNPQIIRYFIDTAQSRYIDIVLLWAAVIFICAGVIQRGVAFAALYVGERVAWTATNALRADLARQSLRLDMPFHKTHTPGELIERVDGDVSTLDTFLSGFIIQLVGNVLLVIAILLLLLREDWRLGLGMTIYVLIAFWALSSLQHIGARRWLASRKADAELFGFLEERLSGTEDIRAAGAEVYTLRRLDGMMENLLQKNRAAQLVGNWAFVITNFLFVVGYALGLAFGAYLYIQGAVSIGTAFLVVTYISMLAAPLEQIRRHAQGFQQASASISRVSELLALQPRVQETPLEALPAGPLAVAFEHVSFQYDDMQAPQDAEPTFEEGINERTTSIAALINDISFRLAPGQVLGLLGRTGSGKTTLTRLLFRLYDPTFGTIRLSGLDVRNLAFADLRSRVGLVTQDVQLFQANIRDNLALFDSAITDQQIEHALRELGLLEWLHTLPEGLNTRLGAGGLGLSAGEAQLLAFARVFLRDPGLVILDEASSRLDPATERLLTRAIDRLLQGRTAIVIAHRLGTVQSADAILILEQGRVAEFGPRAQLAADSHSRFCQLLQTGMEEVLR